MVQLFGNFFMELFQGAGFCNVSWEFIPIPDCARKEGIEIDIAADSLLEKPTLVSFCCHWPQVGDLNIN